jgi:hypothetical protein
VPLCPASLSCSVLADAWVFGYTDFGESHGTLGRPVLRAALRVAVPSRRSSFTALIDTGGPLTVVSEDVIASAGDAAIATGQTLPIRLGGRAFDARLFELALEAMPPVGVIDSRRSWHGLAGVLDPWPHQGTSIILGQIGFMENFTLTFGPDHFAVEPGDAFGKSFAPPADSA